MPLFEFRCEQCSNEFELLVRSNEKKSCPQCNSPKLEKLLSAASSRVSGSSLPIASSPCPPSDAPPCGTGCCRLQ
ncbi:MAG: zinc ribbon domain-containing protein [Planctomycetaceae bacterium]|nr:zinc ribbon domain-containing protein [Planctomycetaceae bacterium]